MSAGQFTINGGYLTIFCSYSYRAAGVFTTAATASGTSSYQIAGGALATCQCFDQRDWTASFTRTVSFADLAITRNDDGRTVASRNAATTYEIDVTNVGPDSVATFHLVDSPPFLEASPAWSASSGSYDASTGSLDGSPALGRPDRHPEGLGPSQRGRRM